MFFDFIEGLAYKFVGLAWILLGVWKVTQDNIAFWFTIAATSTTLFINWYRYRKLKNKK